MVVNTGKNSAPVAACPRGAQIRPGIVVEPQGSQDGTTDNPLLFNPEVESLGDKLEKEEGGSRGERRTL